LKIATYNINGVNGRMPVLLRWLEEAQPDVVCLQELKCESSRFPESEIKKAGYHAIWKGEKSWNGVAILSKQEIRQLRDDLPGEDQSFMHSRYIEGFTYGIVVGCLYLPNGNPYPGPKFDYKLRWFSRLREHGQTLLETGLPVMLVGDYNVMPAELDTYKPEKYKENALFRVESREAYAALLAQGWTDAIRKLYPGERIYTFWDYLRKAYERDAGLRLDHFLLNPALAARLRAGGVDKQVRGWEKSSDHGPVWIELAEAGSKEAKVKSKKQEKLLLEGSKDVKEKKIDGHLIKFTNLNKLYWPEDRVTKRDLFNYYDKVAPYMVPYLLDRPMSLNRFPGGIHGQSFYQKNVAESAPNWARTMPHTNEKGEQKEYLLGHDRATLLWMASLGCIEMNPWFSRVQSPDNPDYCVIDLDPDKNTFEQVIEAAQMTKTVLDGMGVPSYVKTSGSTGIHIYVPLGAQYTYDQSQLFAQVVVKLVHRELPSYTTLERMIANRGGKMYLDFLQNRPGATIAGVYSLRPKLGATVSMPLHWDEVKPGLTMRDFTIHNAPDRLRETGDLFAGVLGKGIDMVAAIGRARETFK
jgi:exodeoxyribonuclease III